MANTIVPKRSTVAGKVPLTSDLQVGEIAVNLTDRKIFTKNAGGSVVELDGSTGVRNTFTAAVTIAALRMVALNTSGQGVLADAGTLAHANRVIGMSLAGAASGAQVTAQLMGEFTNASWSWDVNLPVFLGASGEITQTVPVYPSSRFSLVVGFPISTTKVLIYVREPIVLA